MDAPQRLVRRPADLLHREPDHRELERRELERLDPEHLVPQRRARNLEEPEDRMRARRMAWNRLVLS